jgi:PEP-CTERM motif-containing protein
MLGLGSPATVRADPVALQDYLFNVNGTSYCPDAACGGSLLPGGLDSSAFDFSSGLGTLVWTFKPGAPGAYVFDAFFDHDLHAPFFNEYGAVNGAAGAGVSWQIDEPGFGDGNRLGTIFDNAMANVLDNTNHVPGTTSNFLNHCGGNGGGAPDSTCNNDVSLGMGFNFVLAVNQQVVLTLATSTVRPGGGFFLEQRDPDSPGDDLFLTGALDIGAAAPTTVPEPASLLLVGAGLLSAGWARRSRGVTR